MTYIEMVNGFTKDNYDFIFNYPTLEKCEGAVALNMLGDVLSNPVKAVSTDVKGKFYFTRKGFDVIPFYVAYQREDGSYDLFELNYETYCKMGF